MSSLSEGRLRKKALGACRKIGLMMGVGVIGLTMKGDGGGGRVGEVGAQLYFVKPEARSLGALRLAPAVLETTS